MTMMRSVIWVMVPGVGGMEILMFALQVGLGLLLVKQELLLLLKVLEVEHTVK